MPSIRRVGPLCLLMMISLEPDGQSAHIPPPRLGLPVSQAAQVTHMALIECIPVESGVCMSLAACDVRVCVCVCVHLSTAQRTADTERELRSGPPECESPMNSSVTQLIAVPATGF